MRKENLDIYACPYCKGTLLPDLGLGTDDREIVSGRLICNNEGDRFDIIDGIPRFIHEDRTDETERLIELNRRTVRPFYRDNDDPEYYLTLPDGDFSGDEAEYWKDAASWLSLIEEAVAGRSWRDIPIMIDLGAGCGWLTHKFVTSFNAFAVDADAGDGALASATCYLSEGEYFERTQANIFELPFADSSVDLVIALSIVHLVPDRDRLFEEINRVLYPDGFLFIAGSPVHKDVISYDEATRLEDIRRFARGDSELAEKTEPLFLDALSEDESFTWVMRFKKDIREDNLFSDMREKLRRKGKGPNPLLIGKPKMKKRAIPDV